LIQFDFARLVAPEHFIFNENTKIKSKKQFHRKFSTREHEFKWANCEKIIYCAANVIKQKKTETHHFYRARTARFNFGSCDVEQTEKPIKNCLWAGRGFPVHAPLLAVPRLNKNKIK
jgi:hypothetical protein